MASHAEVNLTDGGTGASDDNDLRAEEGIRAYAERYAKREGVTLTVALEFVRAQIETRCTVPKLQPATVGS